jgi:hypothetical protein
LAFVIPGNTLKGACRLSMTAWAEGVIATTQYEFDDGQLLTATAGDLVTTYGHGFGVLALRLPSGATLIRAELRGTQRPSDAEHPAL